MELKDGNSIYAALLDTRAFYRHIAQLLRSADTFLADSEMELERLCGSAALAEASPSLHQSDKWLPNMAFRFYKVPGEKHRVAFVSIILCPRHPEMHVRPFEEPLVCAGWFTFDKPVSSWTRYGWAGVITRANVPRDGTLHREESRNEGCVEEACFAVPLAQVTTSEELETLVLQPLADALGIRPFDTQELAR